MWPFSKKTKTKKEIKMRVVTLGDGRFVPQIWDNQFDRWEAISRNFVTFYEVKNQIEFCSAETFDEAQTRLRQYEALLS